MGTAPPSWTPREARWQAKAAARAQRDQWRAQARAQRDYYRTYWRGWHRPSFVGPIILLTIGVIALLMETGRLDAVVTSNQASTMRRVAVAVAASCTLGSTRKAMYAVRMITITNSTSKPTQAAR